MMFFITYSIKNYYRISTLELQALQRTCTLELFFFIKKLSVVAIIVIKLRSGVALKPANSLDFHAITIKLHQLTQNILPQISTKFDVSIFTDDVAIDDQSLM